MRSGNMAYNKCLMQKHKRNAKMFQNSMELIIAFVYYIIKSGSFFGKLCPQVCLFKKLRFAINQPMYFNGPGRVIE